MQRTILTVLACCVLALSLAACGDKDNAAEAACDCDKGKAGETVWCEKCAAGYMDGNETKCKDCWSAKQGKGPDCKA